MMRHIKHVVVIGLAVGVLAAGLWSVTHPWSKINCVVRYVDVNTGRSLSVRHLLFLKASEAAGDTEFSQWWRTNFEEHPEPSWRIESTLSGLWAHNSPSYAYHGAFLWQEMVMASFDAASFDGAEKRAIVTSFLELLKSDPQAAQSYATACLTFATEHGSPSVTNTPRWLLSSQGFLMKGALIDRTALLQLNGKEIILQGRAESSKDGECWILLTDAAVGTDVRIPYEFLGKQVKATGVLEIGTNAVSTEDVRAREAMLKENPMIQIRGLSSGANVVFLLKGARFGPGDLSGND